MLRSSVLSLAFAMWLMTSSAGAHHSAAAQYQVDKTISISGVVREFRFVNPHAVIRLAVDDGKGGEVVWSAEWAPTSILRRMGLKADAIRAGDQVTIQGNPARDGSLNMLTASIAFADGRRLGFGGGSPATPGTSDAAK
jgi:uncharacterized protein DUF6152